MYTLAFPFPTNLTPQIPSSTTTISAPKMFGHNISGIEMIQAAKKNLVNSLKPFLTDFRQIACGHIGSGPSADESCPLPAGDSAVTRFFESINSENWLGFSILIIFFLLLIIVSLLVTLLIFVIKYHAKQNAEITKLMTLLPKDDTNNEEDDQDFDETEDEQEDDESSEDSDEETSEDEEEDQSEDDEQDENDQSVEDEDESPHDRSGSPSVKSGLSSSDEEGFELLSKKDDPEFVVLWTSDNKKGDVPEEKKDSE